MREKIERDKVVEKCKGLISVEMAQIVATCLWVRRDEIRGQMVRSSCSITHSHLNDFDWRLKVHFDYLLKFGLDILRIKHFIWYFINMYVYSRPLQQLFRLGLLKVCVPKIKCIWPALMEMLPSQPILLPG